MKFTLKDYQEEAVEEVLVNLKKASKRWHNEGEKHAFSLSATTGAGKTVMAAVVFEALFHGDDNFGFDIDPGAVVIWFSDDPSLNEQTRFRLLESSDKLEYADLVVVKNTFSEEIFEPGKIYFLNTQKLGKKSLLVRGKDSESEKQPSLFPKARPDLRANTIWDTIKNTIEDPSRTLYLVLDEAHRGMGSGSEASLRDKSTIVKTLINGSINAPAIPIVLGISATVERFNTAMIGAEERILLPNVVVDSRKVQDSGLLKDTIVLEIPEKVGNFDKVLLNRATEKIKDLSKAWEKYCRDQNDLNIIKPLMVLQVPNTPKNDDIGEAIDVILKNWPELHSDSFAHVFGERKQLMLGKYSVPHISPERVQESDWIRVLIAKDAISTGWDCPRAEVMVSFRPAIDKTHITQLVGRMIRTPLARRISGNERLNSVNCLLPFFDSKTVENVADMLMTGNDDSSNLPLGRRVLTNPIELLPNQDVSDEIWEKFTSLPSQTIPKLSSKPIKRLTAFAHELANDKLLENAGKLCHLEMHRAMDAAYIRYSNEIQEARKAVLNVKGKSLTVDMNNKNKSFDDFIEDADIHVVEEAYKRAGRIFSPDLIRTYSEYLVQKDSCLENCDEEAFIEAHIKVASMGLIDEISEYLDHEANKISDKWFDKFRIKIKSLSDERKDAYRTIKSWSKEPQDIEISKPLSWMSPSIALESSGKKTLLPTYKKHLMTNPSDNLFPCVMNNWEEMVIEKEISRDDFAFWYRNPSYSSHDSLGISYTKGNSFSILRPDFIFFFKMKSGIIVADIVDPHSIHLSDSLMKIQGLAQYAKRNKANFRRIEAVAEVDNVFRVLDLTDTSVIKAVFDANNSKELYLSKVADDY